MSKFFKGPGIKVNSGEQRGISLKGTLKIFLGIREMLQCKQISLPLSHNICFICYNEVSRLFCYVSKMPRCKWTLFF